MNNTQRITLEMIACWARVEAYELAFRMQMSASECTNLAQKLKPLSMRMA